MNILIATGIYPPEIGGPATYSKFMAEELSRRGHAVTVVTYGAVIPSSRFLVVAVARSLPKGVRHAVYFWKLLRHGFRSDIIYAQDPVSVGIPAALASLLMRKRFILKIVGDYAWEQGVNRFGVKELLDKFLEKKYGWRVELLRGMEHITAHLSEKIIVPSSYLKSVVSRWAISPSKITVIYNAVPFPAVTLSREEAREKIKEEGYLLLSVGRLVPWKGFGMLIELMPDLLRALPDVRLIIIGSGPDYDRLRALRAKVGVEDSVSMLGAKSREELELYYRASDLFLLNTGYEGFSHQLLEVMSQGLPIITTTAGGNEEVVRRGENALIAAYNDSSDWKEKILGLAAHPEAAKKLAESAQNVSGRFSEEIMVEETIKTLL